jgi:hypothetical protein
VPLQVRNPGTPEQSIIFDQNGHGAGGVRTIYTEVPTAHYYETSPGPGVCREMGFVNPLSWAKLEQMYGSYKNYATKVDQTINRLVRERWLTPGDAQRARSELLEGTANGRTNN